MIKSIDTDIEGRSVLTTERRAKLVTVDFAPPKTEYNLLPFSAYFRNDAGSNALNINASITPDTFFISANTNADQPDIYIESIMFQLVDAAIDFSKFGGITALTIGCSFNYDYQQGNVELLSEIKTNNDLLRLTQDNNAEIVTVFKGSDNGYAPRLDVDSVFGFPYGFLLESGKNQSLRFQINDNLSAISEFNIFCTGKQVLK